MSFNYKDNFQPGVDVMITIFCDFLQFSAKLAFFSKTNIRVNFFHNLALFRVKNANSFTDFFLRKYLKNRNIGPRRQTFCADNFVGHFPASFCDQNIEWNEQISNSTEASLCRNSLIMFCAVITATMSINVTDPWHTEKSLQAGVDVMITIFCDFRQFST
jgi:hypothetical protein